MADAKAAPSWSGLIACGLFSTAAAAIPPPPLPPGQIEASSNIAKVATVIEGVWRGRNVGPGGFETELRIGHFGNFSTRNILIGRVIHIPAGRTGTNDVQVFDLSTLTYSIPCHAFEMISLNRIGDTQKMLNDCSTTFPINLQPDGSLSFKYVDESRRPVEVVVKNGEWREDRGPLAGGFTAHRISGEVGWGVINK